MNLTLDVKRVDIDSPFAQKEVRVELHGVSLSDVLDQISIKEIIEHYDNEALLNRIGKELAMEHFNLKEND